MKLTHSYMIKRLLLDLLYPNRCGMCGRNIPYSEYFCNKCAGIFSPPPEDDAIPYIDFFCAYTAYKNYGIDLAAKLKNENNGYAISGAAYLIYKSFCEKDSKRLNEVDLITYIPMRRKDIYKRGYNQCRLMANELSCITDKPFRSLLVKTRDTRQQKTLGAIERRENVKGVFSCTKPKLVKGRTILLIDDISTTGSTLSEAAKVLKEAGAERVYAGVLAKTVYK